MHGFIRNRVYILDINILLRELDNCIDIINKNIMFMESIDFRTRYMLTKTILISVICSHISETNDISCIPLIQADLYNELMLCNEVKIQLDILKNMFYSLYKVKLFNFYNVEVNIDLVLQGTSLYIYSYENDLE